MKTSLIDKYMFLLFGTLLYMVKKINRAYCFLFQGANAVWNEDPLTAEGRIILETFIDLRTTWGHVQSMTKRTS